MRAFCALVTFAAFAIGICAGQGYGGGYGGGGGGGGGGAGYGQSGHGGGGGAGGGGGKRLRLKVFKPPVMRNCRFAPSNQGLTGFVEKALMKVTPTTDSCKQSCVQAKKPCHGYMTIPVDGRYMCAVHMEATPAAILQRAGHARCQGCQQFTKRCSGKCRFVTASNPIGLTYKPMLLTSSRNSKQWCLEGCLKNPACTFIGFGTIKQSAGGGFTCSFFTVGKIFPGPGGIKITKPSIIQSLELLHKVC